MFTAFNKTKRVYKEPQIHVRILKRILLCFCVMPSLSYALETEFTGFANFGITSAKSDSLEFRASLINTPREGLTWQTDTVLGLQMNTRVNNKLDFVGQIILQDRNDHYTSSLLELAFLRYQINRNWSSKLGRFSTNSYLLTDYRYVRHAQYWARPPLEMYSSTGVLGNMNGVQVNYNKDYHFGMFKLSWSYGNSYFRNDQANGKLRTKFDNINALSAEIQTNYWRFQANYIRASLVDFESPAIEQLDEASQTVPTVFLPILGEIRQRLIPEGSDVEYASLGVHYHGDNLEFISELADYTSSWALAQGAQSAYASLSYNVKDFTPYFVMSTTRRDEFPEIVNFSELEATLAPDIFQQVILFTAESNELLRGASIDQDSISIGFRWDLNMDWALKLQIDHNRINEAGSGLFSIVDDAPTPTEKITYNVISLHFSTIF